MHARKIGQTMANCPVKQRKMQQTEKNAMWLVCVGKGVGFQQISREREFFKDILDSERTREKARNHVGRFTHK